MRYLLAVALFLFVLSLVGAFELEEVDEDFDENELNPLEKRWFECGFYNIFTKGCCGSQIYVRKTHGCCGEKVYHKKTEGCCNKKVYVKKTHGCCGNGDKGRKYFLNGLEECCHGKVQYRAFPCKK